MSSRIDTILDRLAALGFGVRRGEFVPFDEPIPIVSATAWSEETAQLVLIAETEGDGDEDAWRQLLFAASGLRHHLAGDAQTAFGTPLVLAVVDGHGQRLLRRIAEDLAQRYLLFTRLDLNVLHDSEIADPQLVDDALAPLLPRCRDLLGSKVARAEIGEFWSAFSASVEVAAEGLDPLFAPYRSAAVAEALDALVDHDFSDEELPAPTPIGQVSLRDFRSIRATSFEMSPVTVIHGPNGGGKSSLLEAMELDWAGTSQRRPVGVGAAEYQRHLVRDSAASFCVTADGRETVDVAEKPRAELSRCVLTHETVAKLVSDAPEERYKALVETTGLELPDIGKRIVDLVSQAKTRADAALIEAGLSELPRRNTVPRDHLSTQLRASFSGSLPPVDLIIGHEEALVTASDGAYELRHWPDQREAFAALVVAEQAVARVLRPGTDRASIAPALDVARDAVIALRNVRRGRQARVETLIAAIRAQQRPPGTRAPLAQPPHVVPADIAARWLSHAKSLQTSADRFRDDASSISDPRWAKSLRDYAQALADVADQAPRRELERASTAVAVPITSETLVAPRLFAEAGFVAPVDSPASLLPLLESLSRELSAQIGILTTLEEHLRRHPARTFHKHSDAVLRALARFALARELRHNSPTEDAGEEIVTRLLQTRLAPALRELVAAMVRFEWHFKPLIVPERGRTVVLGGLATSRPDLDARLLLNSAERTVLGLAWFLALHLLQPSSRRRVLVLDDPTAAFDVPNQAGFISTLRAYVRLTRPAQTVVSTHDDAVAAMLAEQLAPVDGWPTQTTRLRVQRDSADASVVTPQWMTSDSRSLASEVDQLGLGSEPAATSL